MCRFSGRCRPRRKSVRYTASLPESGVPLSFSCLLPLLFSVWGRYKKDAQDASVQITYLLYHIFLELQSFFCVFPVMTAGWPMDQSGRNCLTAEKNRKQDLGRICLSATLSATEIPSFFAVFAGFSCTFRHRHRTCAVSRSATQSPPPFWPSPPLFVYAAYA